MLISLISWLAVVLIIITVFHYSAGRGHLGNVFNSLGTTCWMIMALDEGIIQIFLLNAILFTRGAWMLLRPGERPSKNKTCYDA